MPAIILLAFCSILIVTTHAYTGFLHHVMPGSWALMVRYLDAFVFRHVLPLLQSWEIVMMVPVGLCAAYLAIKRIRALPDKFRQELTPGHDGQPISAGRRKVGGPAQFRSPGR